MPIGNSRNQTTLKRRTRRKATAVFPLVLLWLCSCSDSPAQPEQANPIKPAESGYFVDADYLDKICVASGIDYPIVTEERTIRGANPSSTDATLVKLYRETFSETLGIYARLLLNEIGLKKIVLCRGLSIDGIACVEFSDVERGTMFINIDAGLPTGTLKRNLHHEVFHFIDYAEDQRLDEDRSWSALNPISFAYGSGGGSMQGVADSVKPDDRLNGFLNRYSTSGLAEDKAEVYSYLIFDGPWMIRRASTDPILGRKVELIRATLRRFGPLASGLLSKAQ